MRQIMNWRTILIISAVIAIAVGFSVYIGILIWTKKYTKKYVQKLQRESFEQIKSLRNDIGILPFELENYFKNNINPYDIEGMINTVFINKYYDKLILANNHEFAFSCLAIKTQGKTYYDVQNLDLPKLNQAVLKHPDLYQDNINLYNEQNLDFIGVFDSTYNLETIFNKFYHKLNESGMICIRLQNISRKELNNFSLFLKNKKINFEISYFSTRFLFITNKNHENIVK
ncbi:BC85_0335 family putative methyltransferase [Mycoplasmopsis bovirhinis]|nr:hypothetical protein [Mycoplasmopsis bovirhinis]